MPFSAFKNALKLSCLLFGLGGTADPQTNAETPLAPSRDNSFSIALPSGFAAARFGPIRYPEDGPLFPVFMGRLRANSLHTIGDMTSTWDDSVSSTELLAAFQAEDRALMSDISQGPLSDTDCDSPREPRNIRRIHCAPTASISFTVLPRADITSILVALDIRPDKAAPIPQAIASGNISAIADILCREYLGKSLSHHVVQQENGRSTVACRSTRADFEIGEGSTRALMFWVDDTWFVSALSSNNMPTVAATWLTFQELGDSPSITSATWFETRDRHLLALATAADLDAFTGLNHLWDIKIMSETSP